MQIKIKTYKLLPSIASIGIYTIIMLIKKLLLDTHMKEI